MPFNLNSHLGSEIFDSLRKSPFQPLLCDYGLPKKKKYSRSLVLSLSLLLSAILNKSKVGPYVGVVLPTGIAGITVNFALFLCGRVPVNLNYTLGRESSREIIDQTNIKTVITASKMVEKFPQFPWPKNCILVENVLKDISANWWLMASTFISVLFFPDRVKSRFDIPKIGGNQTAVLLFTSGSSGKPKGVPLSHSNILANCNQLYGLELFKSQSRVLFNLPLFHSFGLSIGMIFSSLRGLYLCTAPNPLDYKLNLKVIREQGIGILLGTPTFLRGLLKNAKDKDLKSVHYVVAGAEKSPDKFRCQWEREVGCEYLEGYGLTETSPAISFNLPGDGKRSGSVGRLLDGIECRAIDPESGAKTSLKEGGVLCFRGPNVFTGYWMDPHRSSEVINSDGWFQTGDVGRLDDDGFLWIEGRISRFSKIGGEMIPHGKVEEVILDMLNIGDSDEPKLVVSSVQDDQKGERLLLVSSIELNIKEIRTGLKNQGIPNLWIPKDYRKVTKIPLLPTGKIDWEKVRSLVKD